MPTIHLLAMSLCLPSTPIAQPEVTLTERFSLKAGVGIVTGADFSPDDKYLAVCSYREEVEVWNLRTGKRSVFLDGHEGRVYGVAFSPDGKRLASVSEDLTARIWDVATWREIHKMSIDEFGITELAFSPDGALLATTGILDLDLRFWEVLSGKFAKKWTVQPPELTQGTWALAFAPDGQTIAVAGGKDMNIGLWDVKTGKSVIVLKGHSAVVGAMAFEPGSKFLLSASADGTVRHWDTATGKATVAKLDIKNRPVSQAFRPQLDVVAVGDWGGNLSLCDVRTGRALVTRGRYEVEFGVRPVAFSRDGNTLAAGVGGAVKVWTVEVRQGK